MYLILGTNFRRFNVLQNKARLAMPSEKSAGEVQCQSGVCART
jgi:hypothetical protein